MKKVIHTGDLCCVTCADRAANKLLNVKGVISAKANYKKSVILIDITSECDESELVKLLSDLEIEVKSIEIRKGIFV